MKRRDPWPSGKQYFSRDKWHHQKYFPFNWHAGEKKKSYDRIDSKFGAFKKGKKYRLSQQFEIKKNHLTFHFGWSSTQSQDHVTADGLVNLPIIRSGTRERERKSLKSKPIEFQLTWISTRETWGLNEFRALYIYRICTVFFSSSTFLFFCQLNCPSSLNRIYILCASAVPCMEILKLFHTYYYCMNRRRLISHSNLWFSI